MNANPKNFAASAACWIARALVCGVFLLWGTFFAEHVSEWFIKPFPQVPPLKVCLFQALHLLLLVGLLASLRWPRVGVVWVIVAALAFFLPVAGAKALAFVSITILPVLLVLFADRMKMKGASKPPMPVAQ